MTNPHDPLIACRERIRRIGYDAVEVLAVDGEWCVFRDTCGNVRIKDTTDPVHRGLRGAFYDNHDGHGETALEAALAAIGRCREIKANAPKPKPSPTPDPMSDGEILAIHRILKVGRQLLRNDAR